MTEHACPSCGVPYRDHLGLLGTCAALLEARRERAQLLAWLRRPVDAEEVIAWLADRHIHVEGVKKRRNGGDVCWTDGKDWIVAYDVRISAARMAIADAIESGEPLSTTGGSKP